MPKTTQLKIHTLGLSDYTNVWQAMQHLTEQRDETSPDEIWQVEHPPVYTLGRAGKEIHILDAANIPVIKTDRGGQVTYHGPGQLIVYILLDINRRQLGIRQLVTLLEQAMIALLNDYGITATTRLGAPGVYVADKKIGALGLRVRKGCTYHGLSFNVNMDLSPFSGINPCGYEGLGVTQLCDLGGPDDIHVVFQDFIPHLTALLKKATMGVSSKQTKKTHE